MDTSFIQYNEHVLNAIRVVHDLMLPKDEKLQQAFDRWNTGMCTSNPELCLQSAKDVVKAAIDLRCTYEEMDYIFPEITQRQLLAVEALEQIDFPLIE